MFLSILSIIGGLIGAEILIKIDQDLLSIIVGIIILISLPLIFIKQEIGTKERQTSNIQKNIGLVLYSFLMIGGGFFGGGIAPLISYCLMFFIGFTIIESNATNMVPWLILSSFCLVLCMINKIVRYDIGITFFAGTLIGGYLGAATAVKKGNNWVKIVFAIVVITLGIKILLF